MGAVVLVFFASGALGDSMEEFRLGRSALERAVAARDGSNPEQTGALMEEAIHRFSEALVSDERDHLLSLVDTWWLRYLRGTAFHSLRDFDSALSDYDRALGMTFGEAWADQMLSSMLRLAKADTLASKVDYKNALIEVNVVLNRYPNFTDAFETRASIYLKMGDLERALEDVNRAIGLAAGLPNLKKNDVLFDLRGEIHQSFGDFARAKADFDVAAKYRREKLAK
jgi:tetratricopeptide (TPR) repeat protein